MHMMLMRISLIMPLLFCICYGYARPSCGGYGVTQCAYVPAKPGQTPSCATAGSTFCESIHGYPKEVITTLLKTYTPKDILKDESRSDFKPKKLSSYHGPYRGHGDHYRYGFPHHHQLNHKKFNQWDSSDSSSSEHKFPSLSDSDSNSKGSSETVVHGPFQSTYFQPSSSEHKYSFNDRASQFNNPEAKKRLIRESFVQSISPRSKRQANTNREQLCEIRTSYINPQAALNSRGNWMYIVNGVETETQLVRTETCASETCSNLCQLPNNYNSRCEQKYIQKRLVALDSNGDKLYTDTFWFPSCCVCTLSTN